MITLHFFPINGGISNNFQLIAQNKRFLRVPFLMRFYPYHLFRSNITAYVR